ncbi:MAG: RnfABCDGE type electron transport complex subunit D [Deltaproteobacteria bacterium]|nr:RnfABCDGE type electron transport complex subunit D [Deltaproteobacteria bacterium]
MKFIRKFLDKITEKTTSGPARFINPLFEAVNTALFDPDIPVDRSPYIRDALNAKRYVFSVVIALTPVLMMSTWYYGYKVLLMLLLAYGIGGFIEALFAYFRKETISEGFLVTGLLFVLIFPVTIPLGVFAVAVVFGIIFGKEVFGGVGHNVFNPALVGRLFVFLSWPRAVSPPVYLKPTERLFEYASSTIDAVSQASPLALFKGTGVSSSFSTLFLGPKPGCIGEISSLLIIAGGIYLILMRVVNLRILISILTAVVLTHFILSLFNTSMMPLSLQITGGGLLLGAFFMSSDPVTSPRSNSGKYIYGAFIGTGVVIFRHFTPLIESMMFSILLGNAFSPLMDEAAIHFRKKKESSYE